MGVTSCGEDEILLRDVSPVIFDIEITDEQGNDLLDPDFEGNIRDKNIVMVYDGETYTPTTLEPENTFQEPESRYYFPHFFGLQYENYTSSTGGSKIWFLSFGEFEGAFTNTYECTLRIQDLNLDYDLKCVIKTEGKTTDKNYKRTETYYLNGEKQSNQLYRLVIKNQ